MSRECGTCRACCSAFSIAPTWLQDEAQTPFQKAVGEPCGYLHPDPDHPGACTVYADRPGACRQFKCAYLLGLGDVEQARPDRSGLIFVLRQQSDAALQPWPVQVRVIVAYESDVRDPEAAWRLLTQVAARVPVLLIRGMARVGWAYEGDRTDWVRQIKLVTTTPRLTDCPWRPA